MKKLLKKLFLSIMLVFGVMLGIVLLLPGTAQTETKTLGVHILNPGDIDYAIQLLKQADNQDKWHYLTVPLPLDDLSKQKEWQDFFKKCIQYKFIPLVRLATKVRNNAWIRPNRKQIVEMFAFMDKLNWPTDERHVIVFNEVNHAKEWGGEVDALSYTQILEFTTNWAHTETANYKVMPAAMDLAAPNGVETMEAFNFLNRVDQYNPWLFEQMDFWNSHSYPNPGFSASPTRTGQNSLRGFEYELNYLKNKTGRDFEVMITETGWVDNNLTRSWLTQYYTYAIQHVWSHPQVKGVTLFLLRGAPGPFESFSFFDQANQPTNIFEAFQAGVKGASTD